MSIFGRIVGCIAGAAVLGGVASPALAEGAWTSYMSGWLTACKPGTGFHTVDWGNKGNGNFDMTLKQIDGAVKSTKGKLYVTEVKVAY